MAIIPEFVTTALKTLESNGFEAYMVGGSVRDFIMGAVPNDYDITTNALPKQIKEIFDGYETVCVGEKHGTIIVIIDSVPVEITTYRVDGNYTDNRRPDKVEFSNRLEIDLKRRDLTINAMAMDINGNVIDRFGGRDDIKNRIARTVGEAEERFKEDALRILRALRFASRLGFTIEDKTEKAIHKCSHLLENISAERIRDEFVGIICGKHSEEILRGYRDVISVFIPEIIPCFDFEQHTPYHKYDVWEHTIHAVGNCADKINVKIAMFFHDIGKPECYKTDETGRGHFKGHPQASSLKAETIMKRLKFPKHIINDVKLLILHHSDDLGNKYEIRKIMGEAGTENVLDLLDVQRADSLSKQDFCRERLKKTDLQEKTVREIAENNECVRIKDLDINGYDLMELGFVGCEIKIALEKLLDNVIADNIENEHSQLIDYAKSLKS